MILRRHALLPGCTHQLTGQADTRQIKGKQLHQPCCFLLTQEFSFFYLLVSMLKQDCTPSVHGWMTSYSIRGEEDHAISWKYLSVTPQVPSTEKNGLKRSAISTVGFLESILNIEHNWCIFNAVMLFCALIDISPLILVLILWRISSRMFLNVE